MLVFLYKNTNNPNPEAMHLTEKKPKKKKKYLLNKIFRKTPLQSTALHDMKHITYTISCRTIFIDFNFTLIF